MSDAAWIQAKQDRVGDIARLFGCPGDLIDAVVSTGSCHIAVTGDGWLCGPRSSRSVPRSASLSLTSVRLCVRPARLVVWLTGWLAARLDRHRDTPTTPV